jgi:phage terminase small subunit
METHLEPQPYLSKRGKAIFLELYEYIPNKDVLIPTDSFGLSAFASRFESIELMTAIINKEGSTQVTQSGYSQVRAEWTILKNDLEYIAKYSDKWGCNPAIRNKEKEIWGKKKKKKSAMEVLISNSKNVSMT